MQMFRLTRRKLSCQKKRTLKFQKQQGLHPRRVPSAHPTTEGREKERRNQKPNSERNADPDGITVPVMTVPKTSSENQVGKIFLISRPVCNLWIICLAGCQFLIIFLAEFTSLITTTLIQYIPSNEFAKLSDKYPTSSTIVSWELITICWCGGTWVVGKLGNTGKCCLLKR